MLKRITALFGLACCIGCVQAFAQSIPIGAQGTDDAIRSLQLMGQYDLQYSLTSRPIFFSNRFTTDSLYARISGNNTADPAFKSRHSFARDAGTIEILPFTFQQQYNSHHPYGWNDGGMIPAKGYQTMLSAGVYARIGPLDVQLRPEFVYAANPQFEYNSEYGGSTANNRNYAHLFPGQSSIRLNAGPVSLGISTENIWWGPGINNALVMTNNAPGMPHITFNSSRPVKTPIGGFEWQLVAGKLKDDSKALYQNYYMKPFASSIYNGTPVEIDHDWRYYNGIVLTYNPKWTPGLFLGITRAFQVFHNDLKLNHSFFSKYLPVFSAFQKDQNQNEDQLRRDQVTSFFLRWVLPKENAELYAEYGLNDHSENTRDFVMSPTHSAAYLLGIRKFFPMAKQQRIEAGFEITQMEQSPDYLVREAANWYWHGQIYQGYTNYNQIMGAGIGGGNNLQTLTVTWVDGWKRLGVILERMENDPQYHDAKWTDYSIGFNGQLRYQKWLFTGLLQGMISHNYAWTFSNNRFNLHTVISASYRL